MQAPFDPGKRWLQLVFLAVPMLAVTAEWHRFPTSLATPWVRYGPDRGWATKAAVLWLFPLLNVAVALLLAWLPRLDPRLRRNYRLTQSPGIKSPATIAAGFAAAGAFISLAVAASALGYRVDVPRLALNAALVLLVVIGNFMGTLRPNYSFGLRTPWTLKSPEVWRATHRLGGRLLVIGALTLLALQFVLSPHQLSLVINALFCAEIAWAFLYSYWRFRLLPDGPTPAPDDCRDEESL